MADRLIAYRYDFEGHGADFLRVRATIRDGRVVRFAAQYETFIDGRVRPVVRYDTAHGRPHRDLLDWDGRVVEKTWLDLGITEALTWAVTELKRTWPTYKAAFLEMMP